MAATEVGGVGRLLSMIMGGGTRDGWWARLAVFAGKERNFVSGYVGWFSCGKLG
jgi:hypothetical protein